MSDQRDYAVVVPVVAASYLPVTVARAKERLHIDASDDDADLDRTIRAAIKAVESDTGQVLAAATFQLQRPVLGNPIRLPLYPIRDVESITYLDLDEVEQTVSPSDWYWLPSASGADVYFVDSYAAPQVAKRPDAVRVTFEAGYDDPNSASEADPRLVFDERAELAVLSHVGTSYAHRESVVVGSTPADMTPVYRALVQQLRIFR